MILLHVLNHYAYHKTFCVVNPPHKTHILLHDHCSTAALLHLQKEMVTLLVINFPR